MYAYISENGGGSFEGVCAPSKATAHSCDPPHHQRKRTGAPSPGLRPEVDSRTALPRTAL
jgi:hypothetical protein